MKTTRYDDKYLDDAANLKHLRRVLLELDTICDTAFGQEIDSDLINSIEMDVKVRLHRVEQKLLTQLTAPACADVAPVGTQIRSRKAKK